jgi:hypothetical protein
MTNSLYFVENQFRSGRAFLELDRDQNSRKAIIDMIRSGEILSVKILEVIEDENSCRDVTAEIMEAAGHVEIEPEEFDHAAAARDHRRDLAKEAV